MDLDNLPTGLTDWLATNGLAFLTTVNRDGRPHATMVGANWDPDARMFRIISNDGAVKSRNIRRDARVSLSFGQEGMWATFEGTAVVTDDPDRVATAVEHYEGRFRPTQENPTRVAIEVTPAKVLGRWG